MKFSVAWHRGAFGGAVLCTQRRSRRRISKGCHGYRCPGLKLRYFLVTQLLVALNYRRKVRSTRTIHHNIRIWQCFY